MEKEKDIEVLMERMKGALVVEVKDETWKKAEDSFRWAVVLHPCNERSFNASALIAALKKAWNIERKIKYREWEYNRVVVKLASEEELKKALEGGSWLFDNWAIIAEKWRYGAKPWDFSSTKIRLWMQIHNFPMELSEEEVPKQLAGLAGKVIKDELQDANKDKQRRKWPRYRLEIDVAEPILPGCYLKLKDGRYTWLDFKYERLPNTCFKCGRMTHETSQCQFVVDAEESKRYGVWLRTDRQGSNDTQIDSERQAVVAEGGTGEVEAAEAIAGEESRLVRDGDPTS
ncbi:hypothetical protein QQ045_005263 [Rhodiola kirilowii]